MSPYSSSIFPRLSTPSTIPPWLPSSPMLTFQILSTRGLWSFSRIAAIQPGSGLTYINAKNIVQGSGIGPAAYDISASDLHPLHRGNYTCSNLLTIHTCWWGPQQDPPSLLN